MTVPEFKKTTKRHLRDVFNQPSFYASLLQRTTHWVLCYDELTPNASGEPPGTMSQIHDYIDGSGMKLASVHRYRRADGSLGASGMLDPHSLLIDGILFYDP